MEFTKFTNNPDLFARIVSATRQSLEIKGIRIDDLTIEKDFHVCEILKEFSLSEFREDACFKGGTSLSKVWKITNRFSEDIDFCVIPQNGNTTSRMAGLKDKISKFIELSYPKINEHPEESKEGGRRKTIHPYPKIVAQNQINSILKENIIFEISTESPTATIPCAKKKTSSYVYDFLLENKQMDIIEQFGLSSVELLVALPEKTLCDKFSRLAKRAAEPDADRRIGLVIRDLYDIHCLLSDKQVHDLFLKPIFAEMYNDVLKEESISRRRIVPPFSNSELFRSPKNVILRQEKSFVELSQGMIFSNIPSLLEIAETFEKSKERFKELDSTRPELTARSRIPPPQSKNFLKGILVAGSYLNEEQEKLLLSGEVINLGNARYNGKECTAYAKVKDGQIEISYRSSAQKQAKVVKVEPPKATATPKVQPRRGRKL